MSDSIFEDDDKELVRRYRLFKALVMHEGWKELEKITQKQLAIRQSAVNTLCHKMDECFVNEGVKGAMIGIALPFETVRAIIEQGELFLKKQNPAKREQLEESD